MSITTKEFRYENLQEDETVILKVHGFIDENAEFPEISTLKAGHLVLDLEDVQLINSIGIRKWVLWLQNSTIPVTLRRCAPPIIEQVNILLGFIPEGAVVESFFIPFFCEKCNKNVNVLVTEGADYTLPGAHRGKIEAPSSQKCKVCSSPLEMDVLPQKYFKFLKL